MEEGGGPLREGECSSAISQFPRARNVAGELHLVDFGESVSLDGCADADGVWEQTVRIQTYSAREILEDAVDVGGVHVRAGEARE